MAGFETLKSAIPEGEAQEPITSSEVAFDGDELSDEAALKIVLQDVVVAEKYLQSKNQVVELDSADNLYRAHVRPRVWPGTDVARSNIGMPIVLESVEKLLPSVYLAFFSDPQPFLLEPAGKTSPVAVRAREVVLSWALAEAEFKEELRKLIKSTLLYGQGIGKWGWKVTSRTIKKYERDPNGKIVPKTVTEDINQPTFEFVELRNVLVDPSLRSHDVRKANYVVQQSFISADALDALRDDETYKNIPSREQLAEIFARKDEPTTDSMRGTKTSTWHNFQGEQQNIPGSADPRLQPLEVLEYWTPDRVVTVVQRKIVIRNEANEFGKLPFVSCAFIDVPMSFYGFGVAKLLGNEQRLQQGIVNSWVDTLSLQLNPTFQLQKGVGAGTQQIKIAPGKVITESGELKPLVVPSVTTEALNAISNSEQRATRRVGASASDMPTQALRTAEGVQAFSSGLVDKLQYFVDIFAETVFVPVLEAFVEMCNDKLTPEQINEILSDEEGKAFEGDVLDFYNANCKIKVLSSTKLAARRAAAQMIPTIVQLVTTQPFQESLTVQGKKFDYEELLDEGLELMGWSIDSLIVDMTPDDMKRVQMSNPAVIKAQSDAQLEQQRHQNTMEQIDEQGAARAGSALIRDAVKQGGSAAEAQVAQQLLGSAAQQQPEAPMQPQQ